MAHNLLFQCEKIAELQVIIHDLLKSRSALFRRSRGDPGAVRDFIEGQDAIVSALKFLSVMPDSTDELMTEVIQTVWRRFRLGPTLGTGQACQYLLNYLYEMFGNDSRLEWPGWQQLNW